MGQRSSPRPYLRVMAQEIQWEGAQVTNDTALQDILSPEHAQWTPLSSRSWSVVLHGRRFKWKWRRALTRRECHGPHQRGSEGRPGQDERSQLWKKWACRWRRGWQRRRARAMPGKVLQVLVEPGHTVEEGQPLLVLEAMKMENVIKATAAGTVSEVPVNEGDAVEKGACSSGSSRDWSSGMSPRRC